MSNKIKNVIDTLMTKEDLMIGTNRILKKIDEITKIMKDDHRNYHKNRNEVCHCKQNNSHPAFA